MPKHPTLLHQFRSFCLQNHVDDMEKAIEYFSVFGGTSWKVDMHKPLLELIETKIFKNYPYIHSDIAKITFSNKLSHTLLSAMATGDRRVHSTFKRAHISREEGESALDTLLDSALIRFEYSLERPVNADDDNSDKLSFMTPFMRFWFAFVSPFYKTIKEGDYSEVEKSFASREQEFYELIFKKLSFELLRKIMIEDPIVEVGSYWDKNAEIDILAKTQSGKLIAGSTKYKNTKVKKTELTKLKEQCAKADFEPDLFVILSKSGFTSELKALKGDDLKLFTIKSMKALVEDVSEKELIPCEGKKY
ncbi:DUF234 domain-containing protein [Sulfurospirillum diekertiae]|uniref:DUF234 domain-containing protein n=1 Tax=Sulfurospirillum diekertiae TaxID=1854492 RepID=A0A1Y0HP17_9BACT|nr:DUF234 domain-containing protein [Sulfurospirillum diekertiae]ARU49848.1 hypothetical protein Sdiek1_2700 [Sulfurospirillum diekertiae]ASC94639.1 hypothetical protein Sdiek2_2637 [Sulfurospirillum diekertiae]